MEAWKKIVDATPTKNRNSNNWIFAAYGYTGYLIESKQEALAKIYLAQLDSVLDQQLAAYPKKAEWLAMKGACIGMQITSQPMKAPVLGKKSSDYLNKALQASSMNAYALFEKANFTYYLPEAFGGGVKRALPILEQAVKTMEKRPNPNNWIYLLAKTNLAFWYAENKDYKNARRISTELREIEPNDYRVNEKLMPILFQ